jgi:hypothetical protein
LSFGGRAMADKKEKFLREAASAYEQFTPVKKDGLS